jgi:glutathione peroxidase
MKNLLIIGATIFMFFFKSSSNANYDRIFYDFKINSISGELINLSDYRGKPVLIVNTASYCGFTKQYDDMQELWDKYKDKGLIVLGVPSNSFNQEKKICKFSKEIS